MRRTNPLPPIPCKHCGQVFQPANAHQVYCKPKCAGRARYARTVASNPKKLCRLCGDPIPQHRSSLCGKKACMERARQEYYHYIEKTPRKYATTDSTTINTKSLQRKSVEQIIRDFDRVNKGDAEWITTG
jgi:hypothetical protein